MRKILPLFIILLFLLQSCNTQLRVEKRHYSKGYYVETKASNKATNNILTQPYDEKADDSKTVTELAYYRIPTIEPIVESSISQIPDGLLASVNKIDCYKVKTHVASVLIDSNKISKKIKFSHPKIPLVKKSIKKNLLVKENSNSLKKRGLGSLISGIILLSFGSLIFFFVFWPLGVLMLIAGLITLLVGTILYSKRDKNPLGEFQETIYLKNGSIIKGSIIEQVIDDYVKVRMKDGNVLVYKMTEVEKITKEKVSN